MKLRTRVKLEVGSYSKSFHYCVIGEPNDYYLWHKEPGMKGRSSEIFNGPDAFKHYERMRQLLQHDGDRAGFIAYLTDLFNKSFEVPRV